MESDFDIFESVNNTKYGTHLNYSCPLAHRFVNASNEPVDDNVEVFCEWETSAMSVGQLPDCLRKLLSHRQQDIKVKCTRLTFMQCFSFQAYGCANPEWPPEVYNLEFSDYVNDTVVNFGDNVTYKCLDEHYFVTDFHQETIHTTCKTDKSGTWTPPPWVQCIKKEGIQYDSIRS